MSQLYFYKALLMTMPTPQLTTSVCWLNTVAPAATEYTKGSAVWMDVAFQGLETACSDGFDHFVLTPAYESLGLSSKTTVRELPYYCQPSGEFHHYAGEHFTQSWSPVSEEKQDLQLPIPCFTRAVNDGYIPWADLAAHQARAVLEAKRFMLDWSAAVFGLPEAMYDVVFPQHAFDHLIVAAHYMAAGRAVGIAHGTGARLSPETNEGGWAAHEMRQYIHHALQRAGSDFSIIAISDFVQDMLAEGVTKDMPTQVRFLSNPYDDAVFYPKPVSKLDFCEKYKDSLPEGIPTNGKWMTFVGRPIKLKGIDQMLRAWARYLKTPEASSDDCLLIVGPALTDNSVFAEHARALGILNNVVFLGKRAPEFIADLHRAANLATMPSLKEGDGVACKEPAACGTRVVVTDSGGPGVYCTEQMGTKALSRDPDLEHSKSRGYELLAGRRNITWGNITLSAKQMVTDYVMWARYYNGLADTTSLDRLDALVAGWRTADIREIRHNALAVLQNAPLDSVPSKLRNDVMLLVRVFADYGGRDVEVESLFDAYHQELSVSPEVAEQRGLKAHEYVKGLFSSQAYALEIAKMLKAAATSQKDFVWAPSRGWEHTSVMDFDRNERAAKLYKAIQKETDPQKIAKLVYQLQKTIVKILGNPKTYQNQWVSPDELAFVYAGRSDEVAARIIGCAASEFQALRLQVAALSQGDSHFRDTIYQLYLNP